MPGESWQEELHHVAVAWAAVGAQEALEEDVLRHQHLLAESVSHEASDVARVIFIARARRLLVGVEDLHADHVVLQIGTAS